MSITPIFDATVKASDPDLYKASTVFPQPSVGRAPAYAKWLLVEWDRIEAQWGYNDPRFYAKVTGEFPKPEPKWRTFLRCLLWWLP